MHSVAAGHACSAKRAILCICVPFTCTQRYAKSKDQSSPTARLSTDLLLGTELNV